MTREQIKIKYDEFFGIGLWERDYKSHIVIFAENCLMDQERKFPLNNVKLSLLKARRVKLNLTMRDVNDQTNISTATISRIEHGKDASFKTVIILDEFYSNKET